MTEDNGSKLRAAMQAVDSGNTRPYVPMSPPLEKRAFGTDINRVLEMRKATHGKYVDHAGITQSLKTIMRGTEGWLKLTPTQQETLDMTAHKIARILAGDPSTLDHWVDIIGYNKLIVDELEAK